MAHIVIMSDESQSATRNTQSAIRDSPLELRDSAVAYACPTRGEELRLATGQKGRGDPSQAERYR
jgi:hypothetical protein